MNTQRSREHQDKKTHRPTKAPKIKSKQITSPLMDEPNLVAKFEDARLMGGAAGIFNLSL
jgi:hypothetical protein